MLMKFVEFLLQPSTLTILCHWSLVVGLGLRVIMKRPATGVALSWLLVIATLPLFGALLYLMIGERRIGNRRSRRIDALRTDYDKIASVVLHDKITDVPWSKHPSVASAMDRLARQSKNFPTVTGSRFELFSDTPEILRAMAREIDGAKKTVLMEFYIWNEGGIADEVLEAVIRAAQRGVSCRLLIDALGARSWWKGKQPKRLREAGVLLLPALPVGIFRTFVGRTDLRVHRKIVVVDSEVAWTGSMNLVDPSCFKQDADVGEWVDAMIRVRGSIVSLLAATMIGDWILETGETLDDLVSNQSLRRIEPDGSVDIQVYPSGPGQSGDGLLQMILTLVNSAREELVMTTPYLVPDESLLRAIRGAAGRGVKVSLVVPEKVDSFLTRYASRSYFADLLDIGVQIYLFRGGLLHTKSITVDGRISKFGTANLDMRSLWINYEVSCFVYDQEFAKQLRQLQQSYIDDSDVLEPVEWSARSFQQRLLENTMRLVSPLL
jgi:cardiolipin synthase